MTFSIDSKTARIAIPLVVFVSLALIVFTLANRKTSEDVTTNAQSAKTVVNYAPIVQNIAPIKAIVGQEYSYTLEITDADTSFDKLSASLIESPSWLQYDNFKLSGIPSSTDVTTGIGSKVVVQITDGQNTITKSYYITVSQDE